MRTSSLALAILLWAGGALAQSIPGFNAPQSRVPTWEQGAGVQGGLPDTSSWPVHQTMSTGWTASQLQTAIDGAAAACESDGQCPDGTNPGYVVELPAETRDLQNGSPVIMRTNVVVRGAGSDQTILRVNQANTGNQDCEAGVGTGGEVESHFLIFCGEFQGFDNTEITTSSSTMTVGTDEFTVGTINYNASDYTPGRQAVVCYMSKNSSPYTSGRTTSVGEAQLCHVGTITAFNSGTKTFTMDRGLRLDWSLNDNLNCSSGDLGSNCYGVRTFTPIENSGLESVTLEGDHTGPIGGDPISDVRITENDSTESGVKIQSARNVWLKDVGLKWFARTPLGINQGAVNVTVTGSRIGDTLFGDCLLNISTLDTCWNGKGAAGRANAGEYLISAGGNGSQDILIVNNVFVGHAIGIRFREGANGWVVAHNYYDGQNQYQDDSSGKDRSHGLAFMHGKYPHNVLVEGNDVNVSIGNIADDIFDLNGSIVLYRNRGDFKRETCVNPIDAGHECGSIHTEPNGVGGEGMTLLANHVKRIGAHNTTQPMMANTVMTDGWAEFNIVHDDIGTDTNFGFRFSNGSSAGPLDCGDGLGTCVKTGTDEFERNLEAAAAPDNSEWNTAAAAAPDSLYFTSQSDWESQSGYSWPAEACDWDAATGIGAFGDDETTDYCDLPAEIWYTSGLPPDPTPSGGRVILGGSVPGGVSF